MKYSPVPGDIGAGRQMQFRSLKRNTWRKGRGRRGGRRGGGRNMMRKHSASRSRSSSRKVSRCDLREKLSASGRSASKWAGMKKDLTRFLKVYTFDL